MAPSQLVMCSNWVSSSLLLSIKLLFRRWFDEYHPDQTRHLGKWEMPCKHVLGWLLWKSSSLLLIIASTKEHGCSPPKAHLWKPNSGNNHHPHAARAYAWRGEQNSLARTSSIINLSKILIGRSILPNSFPQHLMWGLEETDSLGQVLLHLKKASEHYSFTVRALFDNALVAGSEIGGLIPANPSASTLYRTIINMTLQSIGFNLAHGYTSHLGLETWHNERIFPGVSAWEKS